MTRTKFNTGFYQNLGKLFYALAIVDRTIHDQEVKKLQELVKSHWLDLEDSFDDFDEDNAYQLEVVFDWLSEQSKISSEEAYQEFIEYSFEHAYFFNERVKKLVIKTASSVASTFAGKNKSELIFLARLEDDLRRINATGYNTNILET